MMLNEELSSDMDRITQLQDSILDLLTITATSIDYITKRTHFEPTNPEIPVTVKTQDAAPRDEYKQSIETFVQDIVRRSKDCERLIAALPSRDESSTRIGRLEELKGEMEVANQEYREALAQAEELMKELQAAMGAALGPQGQEQLAKAIKSVSPS